MSDEKVDVSFSNGWLHGRFAMQDHSSGSISIGPGLEFSVRLDAVSFYHVAEIGVLNIGVDTMGQSFMVIGSLETIRGIMARENIREAG